MVIHAHADCREVRTASYFKTICTQCSIPNQDGTVLAHEHVKVKILYLLALH
jgi:hypothetical protein